MEELPQDEINIESCASTLQMADRMILPAALRYQEEVARSIASLKAAGASVPKAQAAHFNELVEAIDWLQTGIEKLNATIDGPRGRRFCWLHAKHFPRRDHSRHDCRPRRRRSA